MGWTSLHRRPGQTDAEFFGRELNPGDEIVAHNTSGSGFERTFYAAVRKPDGTTWALVVLCQTRGREFIYKDMDETVGPNEVGVSRKVLEALTPTDSKYANEWRERAWADVAKREEAAALTKGIKPGQWVRFHHPIAMTNGHSYRFGRFVRPGEIAVVVDGTVAEYALGAEQDVVWPRYGVKLGREWRRRIAQVADQPSEFRDHIDPEVFERAERTLAHLATIIDARRTAGEQGRVGRGVPAGGQFTGHHRPDADVTL